MCPIRRPAPAPPAWLPSRAPAGGRVRARRRWVTRRRAYWFTLSRTLGNLAQPTWLLPSNYWAKLRRFMARYRCPRRVQRWVRGSPDDGRGRRQGRQRSTASALVLPGSPHGRGTRGAGQPRGATTATPPAPSAGRRDPAARLRGLRSCSQGARVRRPRPGHSALVRLPPALPTSRAVRRQYRRLRRSMPSIRANPSAWSR